MSTALSRPCGLGCAATARTPARPLAGQAQPGRRSQHLRPRIRRGMWLRGHNEGPAPAGPSPYSPALLLGQVLALHATERLGLSRFSRFAS